MSNFRVLILSFFMVGLGMYGGYRLNKINHPPPEPLPMITPNKAETPLSWKPTIHHTIEVPGEWPSMKQRMWLYLDTRTECASYYHDGGYWQAFAYEDHSRTHYYNTEKEARAFVAGWCQP